MDFHASGKTGLLKKRIFITGGTGLLAVNCALQLRDTCDISLALHARPMAIEGIYTAPLNLETPADIRAALETIRPDCVIHAAAITSVEQCERAPERARQVNVQLSRDLAAACAEIGCTFVHISTDHLFDGAVMMADEELPVSPLNAYGASKAEAECAITAVCPDSLIIRTNFYGWGPPWRQSFSDSIITALRGKRPVSLFADVYYTPILIEPLVAAIVDLVEGRFTGRFNVAGDERLSKYEFGILVAKAFGLDPGLIQLSSIADMPQLVARPREMSLSNAKVCRVLGRSMGAVRDHLDCLSRQEQNGVRRELDGLGNAYC